MAVPITVSYFCSISLGVIILFGVIGNTLSFIVWSSGRQCSTMSCGYYLRLIAVADLFSLLGSGVALLLAISPARIALFTYSDFLCKIIPFSAHLSVQVSSWLVVSVTIERTLSIRYPIKFYNYCKSKNRANLVFLLIIIVAVILDFMTLWLYEVKRIPVFDNYHFLNISKVNSTAYDNLTRPYCDIRNNYSTLYRIWNLYISFGCFIVGLPPTIITVCNIVTLVTLRQKWTSGNDRKSRRKSSTPVSFTYIVIVISVINCISTLPVGYLYIQFDYFDANMSPVFYRVSIFLFFLNSGTNVIFYCWMGKAFRKDLKKILKSVCCKCKSESLEPVVAELQ